MLKTLPIKKKVGITKPWIRPETFRATQESLRVSQNQTELVRAG